MQFLLLVVLYKDSLNMYELVILTNESIQFPFSFLGYEKLKMKAFVEYKFGLEIEGNLPSTAPHGNSEFVSSARKKLMLEVYQLLKFFMLNL